MKFLCIFGIFLLVSSAQGNWLSNLFTGLSEVVDDAKVKEKMDTLGSHIKKVSGKIVKNFKTDLPNNDWVEVTKDYLQNITFKDILQEEGDEKMEELVEKWNLILQELNNPEKFETAEAMYKKINGDLKSLLPKKLFRQWKKKVHNIAMKIKQSVQAEMKGMSVETLKKQAKKWVEPIFMQHKENIEEEKQMVKEAIKAANEELMGKAKEAHEKVVPVLKGTLEDAKEMKESHESKIQKWLEKTFTKPHHASRWLTKDSLKEIRKQYPGFPVKKIKKLFKKMAKKNKKIIVVTKPIETKIEKVTNNEMDEEKLRKLAALTPQERAEYEKAEAEWEQRMLQEAMKVSEKMAMKKDDEKKKPMMTGNEKWEDEEDDDDDEDDKIKVTSPLGKAFTEKLAAEEEEWYGLRKKLKAML